MMHLVFWSLSLIFLQLFFTKVENHAIFIKDQERGVSNNGTEVVEEDFYLSKNITNRGLVDILENFRLWQLERKRMNPSSPRPPTPEPMGLEAFIPKIPDIKIDQNTLGNFMKGLEGAAQDIVKSFVGPPSTTESPEVLAKNASTTIPPNELFCFLC